MSKQNDEDGIDRTGDILTTSSDRALQMMNMRKEIANVALRYHFETDVTLEELLGAVDLLRLEMALEWPKKRDPAK